jgi:hypothetical protein
MCYIFIRRDNFDPMLKQVGKYRPIMHWLGIFPKRLQCRSRIEPHEAYVASVLGPFHVGTVALSSELADAI